MYTKYTYTYMSTIFEYIFDYNRLHLFKICFCCFLDIHLYSNNLSTIATLSLLIMSELFPACFSCNSNRNLLQSSSGLDDRIIVFVNPEAVVGG